MCVQLGGIRYVIGLSGIGLAAAMLVACSGQATPAAAPDPFSSVAQQSADAYAQGAALFDEGRYTEARDALTRAQLLSPTHDPSIDEMLQRTNAALAPTATAVPPTPVPTEAPTPVAQSTATPATDLGVAYFGRTFVSVVPGKAGAAVPMMQFSVQDQLGLYVEKLDERLHLGFAWRLFDADSGVLVTNVSGETMPRFLDNFVWYHQGNEAVGHYRAELYASDVLTNTFEYVVGTEPVPIPTPVPSAVPTPAQAQSAESPAGPAVTPARVAETPSTNPASRPTTVYLVATPTPAPAPLPEAPQPRVTRVNVAAGPAALAAGIGSDQVFVADRSGLVWIFEHGQPLLRQPYNVSAEPVGLAADVASSRLYVALRNPPALAAVDLSTGQRIATEPLPSDPGELVLDTSLGQLFVALSDRESIETIDIHSNKALRLTPGLRHVTGMAVDAPRHHLYVGQLEGNVSVIDTLSGAIVSTLHLSDVGLSGIALGTDRLYAINTPGQALLSLDPASLTAEQQMLSFEPSAIVVGPFSGTVFVLNSQAATVTRVTADGNFQPDLNLGQGAGQSAQLDLDNLWRRPRLALSAVDESVYAIEPDAVTLAIAAASP